MQFITDGVGRSLANRPSDVFIVQKLLNMNLGRFNHHRVHALHPVDASGLFDSATGALLQAYCQWLGRGAAPVILATSAAAAATVVDPKPGAAAVPAMPAMPRLGAIGAMGAASNMAGMAALAAMSGVPFLPPKPAAATPSGPPAQAGELARLDPVLLSLVHGALAWQGQVLPVPTDPVLQALDNGGIATWAMFKALCRMRQSRSLLAVLVAMAPTVRKNKKASAEAIAESVALAMAIAEINTPLRKAGFLSQIAAESDGFRALREYASGAEYEGRADLGNVLPGDGKRFAGRGYIQLTGRANYTLAWQQLGLPLLHNDKLKPFVSAPKAKFKTDIEPADPSYGETLEGAAKLTAWYWNQHKLNAICDRLSKVGKQDAVLLQLSIAINGKNKKTGLPNGWDHRKRYFKAAKHALGIL